VGTGQFAHTSPLYVVVAGRSVLCARSSDADYFASWCDACLKAWKANLSENPEEMEHDSRIVTRIQQAKEVFLELKSMGNLD
jgi:hypothetical protein